MIYLVAFALAIFGGYQLSDRKDHQESLDRRYESVARMMGLYHAAALDACDPSCSAGEIDVSSNVPDIASGSVLLDGRYLSVSDGSGLVVTVYAGEAQTGYSQNLIAAAVRGAFGGRRGVGRWNQAAETVGSYSAVRDVDNRISVPALVGGYAFSDNQVMIASD